MENILNVALIQSDIIWENPSLNLSNLTYKIQNIKSKIDLIVLQEMFTTGYTLNAASMAETMTGNTINWMLKTAKEKDALIMGSIIVKESDSELNRKENYYNRLIVAYPNGEIQHYDKRHLFSYADENKIYSAGMKRTIIKYKGWKLLPLICYDLRFPVWSRNTEEYDVLIYMANWPNTRVSAWDTLLKARAIENLSYVIGVNRLGKDSNNLEYVGHSAVIDSMGKPILEFDENQEATKTVVLIKNHIEDSRNNFGFLSDKDDFEIKY